MFKLFLTIACLLNIIFSPAYAVAALSLSSNSFNDQGALPKIYTCDGRDISPELHWSGIPENTKSQAVVVADLDAPGGTFYHWILYNIPLSIKALPTNVTTLPAGSILGKNSWGKAEYNGPCPPKKSTHYYVFTLYTLDTMLDIPKDADPTTILESIKKHMIDKIELSATYGRN